MPPSTAVEVRSVVPPEVADPVRDNMPAAVTLSVPLALLVPRDRAVVSARMTLLPLPTTTEPKSLPLFKVMSFAVPAASVVVPVMVEPAVSVIAPAVFRLKIAAVIPLTPSTVLRSMSFRSVNVAT